MSSNFVIQFCNLFCVFFIFSIGGGELFDRVIEDEFVLTEKACVAFIKQIIQGVEFMHAEQIIHLDLKVNSSMLS